MTVDESAGNVFLNAGHSARTSQAAKNAISTDHARNRLNFILNMRKTFYLLSLTSAALLSGCDKQAKINSEKIQMLSQNIIQFENRQAKQMAALQAQLTSLAPTLDRMNSSYFEKSRDDGFFYHTNTLYLLLLMGQKIEAHLQASDLERDAENSRVYAYHTNELDMSQIGVAQMLDAVARQENSLEETMTNQESRMQDAISKQENRIRDALAAQESRMEDKINIETRRVGAALSAELQNQIKLLAPDAAETARRRQLEADVAQIKRELELIKAQLGQMTNQPVARP